MTPPRWPWMACLGAAALLPAQQFAPRAGYLYPAGGQRGSTFEVTVGGQFLDGVSGVYVSGAGVQASLVRHTKPMSPMEFNKLRERLKELMDKRVAGKTAWTAADQREVDEIRKKIAGFVRRPANPAIAETVLLRVTVAPDAPLGERDLRLGTPLGLTNPLRFRVGQFPEYSRKPARVSVPLPNNPAAKKFLGLPAENAPEGPLSVTLPAVLNGQILPGRADRFRFQARKGQKLVAAVAARELIPYISDAVPGWFQATIALLDASGREVAYADDYRFHPDPVLCYQVPEDGEYQVEIKDAIYRGREDFVYRIELGELPYLTSVFPPGGKTGARTKVALAGWNLPAATVVHHPKDGEGIQVRQGRWISNRLPFAADTLPESLEREPNNQPKGAQRVKLPIVVNGRIHSPADRDLFRIQGRAGEELVAEVMARRLGSPLDSTLRLTDAAGREVAASDDWEDKGAGLVTHHADSRIAVRLPKKGTYYLHLGDAQGKGGEDYVYRLRISRPRPDFELRVTPAGVNLRAGASVPVTVHALRRDGFAGEIKLELKNAPPGLELGGGWVPAGVDKLRVTLTAAPGLAAEQPLRLEIVGRAAVEGRELRRPAVPAEDMEQAFAYHHLVPAQDWLVKLAPAAGRLRAPLKLSGDTPLKLAPGATAGLHLALPLRWVAEMIRLELSEPPEGIAIDSVAADRGGLAIRLRADPQKAKPGLKGNLIVNAYLERPAAAGGAKPAPNRRRTPVGTLPAIPFEVAAR